jgi:hypothetical protein
MRETWGVNTRPTFSRTTQFRRDVKLARRRGKDMGLEGVVDRMNRINWIRGLKVSHPVNPVHPV